MFFSDNGPNRRIEKASLDGQDRVIIAYKGLYQVISLTVDTANKKLYWADLLRHTIEESSYDGSNRRVIRRMNLWFVTGVVYHQVLTLINEDDLITFHCLLYCNRTQFYMP